MITPRPPLRNTLYRQETRATRRLTRTRLALYRAGVPVASALIRLLWATTRVIAVIGEGRLEQAIREHGVVIPVYWHQHQLLPVRYLLDHRARGLKPGFLISPSVDGEMPAMLVRRAGGFAIRGSSSATGARALRDHYEAMTRDGVSPSITPDGPSGPAREFKPGAILLSQISGKPMLPMAFAARRVYRFRTWDQFILPMPFTPSVLAIGEPCQAPRRLDAGELASWQERMQTELVALYRQASAKLSGAGL
ncbi:MAG: lysophospholipid acyltransferase family protein [Steroidobacteraceae bacterium]